MITAHGGVGRSLTHGNDAMWASTASPSINCLKKEEEKKMSQT
jgi:hypothetical protein